MKYYKNLLLTAALIITLCGCAASNNIDALYKKSKNIQIGESKISYNGGITWFDFEKQDAEIQNYYLNHVKEIIDCLDEMKPRKIQEDEFDGEDILKIYIGEDYELYLTACYPDSVYIKITINNSVEYYYLNSDDSTKINSIITDSDNYPFKHITLMEYLQKEQ